MLIALPAEKVFLLRSTDIYGNLRDISVFPKSLKLPTDSCSLIFNFLFFYNQVFDVVTFNLIVFSPHEPPGLYLFKVSNGNTTTTCEICSKLTIKTPEWRYWRRFGIFIVNFEQISHIVVVFSLLALNKQMSAGKALSMYIFQKWNLYFFRYLGLWWSHKGLLW